MDCRKKVRAKQAPKEGNEKRQSPVPKKNGREGDKGVPHIRIREEI